VMSCYELCILTNRPSRCISLGNFFQSISRVHFPVVKAVGDSKLTTHHHLGPKLRINGVTSLLHLCSLLQTGRSRVRFPMRSLNFLNLTNPSRRAMALGFAQRLTKMSTREIFLGVKRGRLVRLTVSNLSRKHFFSTL
jgi:hypothetical protein